MLLTALLSTTVSANGIHGDYRKLPGGDFRSSVRFEEAVQTLPVAAFWLMQQPVSNRQFAAFVQQHPQWRRDQVPAIFASPGYLGHWADAETPGPAIDHDAPVTYVNWYAADAYCRAQQARLPTFMEWEYAAAADATRTDARHDPQWRKQLINDGTARARDASLNATANVYGIHGLHGAYWEWSEDYASLLGAGDRRGQQDGDSLRYCGATALSFTDPSDYAVIKRFVLLSALQPGAALGNLGFRCARSSP